MTLDRRGFLALITGGVLGAADQALDVQLLQTAASIENVLVSAYDTILGLPAFTAPTANAAVKNLLITARDQHTQHATAANELAQKLGGRAQTGQNSFVANLVGRARPGLGELVQRKLLEQEGVVFDAKDRVDLDTYGWHPEPSWLRARGLVVWDADDGQAADQPRLF